MTNALLLIRWSIACQTFWQSTASSLGLMSKPVLHIETNQISIHSVHAKTLLIIITNKPC